MIPIGTLVQRCGDTYRVSAVGYVGERYYWLSLVDDEDVTCMVPAHELEPSSPDELKAQREVLLTYARRFFAAHDGTAGLTPEEVAAWREVVRKVEQR